MHSNAKKRHMSSHVVEISEDDGGILSDSPSVVGESAWKKDLWNIALLVGLYCFQGVPLGLSSGALPFILKNSGASYGAVGVFSYATLPFSLKLFWAPIVDTVYHPDVGRRKSWIVPIQIISGLLMIMLSFVVDELVSNGRILLLTSLFFVLILLYATQDIAVDGWALELLSPENLSYASTAQSVGQSVGFFLSFTVFLALQSSFGVTLGTYLCCWGVIFIVASFWLWRFKKEDPLPASEVIQSESPLLDVYMQVWKIVRLRSVQRLALFLATSQVFLVANDKAFHLRLMEVGFSKELLASLALAGLPLGLIFAVFTGKWAQSGEPLSGPMFWGICIRLSNGLLGLLLLSVVPAEGHSNIHVAALFGLFALGTLGSSLTFVSVSAFFNAISDRSIGGTYLTLLNSMNNIGRAWCIPFVMPLIDVFGFSLVSFASIMAGLIYVVSMRGFFQSLEDPNKNVWIVGTHD